MTESKKMEQIIYEEIVTKEGVTFNSDGKKHIERAMEEYSTLQCRERDERIRELEKELQTEKNGVDVLIKTGEEDQKTISQLQDKVKDLEEKVESLNKQIKGREM